jgi:hypothetical protein
MDKAHLGVGGGLLALDASPRPLRFLSLLPPTTSPLFHRTRRTTMEAADDGNGTPPGRGRRSIEVDFFSDDKDKKTAAKKTVSPEPAPPAGSGSAASCLAIKKEDLTINVRYFLPQLVLIASFISSLD